MRPFFPIAELRPNASRIARIIFFADEKLFKKGGGSVRKVLNNSAGSDFFLILAEPSYRTLLIQHRYIPLKLPPWNSNWLAATPLTAAIN
ncbi:unnamed protein product [Oikopleura dioica]|uniref:Uncharacterized protein n=1 Tax=Oikopleura dioica TaxID=34765 RepID=E4Y706_OIKDI|nr:unnamed protein product [Oikopleura dioica]